MPSREELTAESKRLAEWYLSARVEMLCGQPFEVQEQRLGKFVRQELRKKYGIVSNIFIWFQLANILLNILRMWRETHREERTHWGHA